MSHIDNIREIKKKINKINKKLRYCLDEQGNVPQEFKESWFNLNCELAGLEGEEDGILKALKEELRFQEGRYGTYDRKKEVKEAIKECENDWSEAKVTLITKESEDEK